VITDIVHAGIDNGSIWGYACNMACGYHVHKLDFSWKHVTCKNCLNLIKKHERIERDNGEVLLGSKLRGHGNDIL